MKQPYLALCVLLLSMVAPMLAVGRAPREPQVASVDDTTPRQLPHSASLECFLLHDGDVQIQLFPDDARSSSYADLEVLSPIPQIDLPAICVWTDTTRPHDDAQAADSVAWKIQSPSAVDMDGSPPREDSTAAFLWMTHYIEPADASRDATWIRLPSLLTDSACRVNDPLDAVWPRDRLPVLRPADRLPDAPMIASDHVQIAHDRGPQTLSNETFVSARRAHVLNESADERSHRASEDPRREGVGDDPQNRRLAERRVLYFVATALHTSGVALQDVANQLRRIANR